MADEIKKADVKELRELGLIHELNRLFLHPLGLAIEVVIDDETGRESLGGIWDYREDPEGILFGKDMIDPAKIKRFRDFQVAQHMRRMETLGFLVQEE